MKWPIGSARGTARLSGTKHEAFSIAGDQSDGEEVLSSRSTTCPTTARSPSAANS